MGTDLKSFEQGRLFTSHCKDGTVEQLIDKGVDLMQLMRRYQLSRSTIVRKLQENSVDTPTGFYVGAKFQTQDRVIDSDARRLALSARW